MKPSKLIELAHLALGESLTTQGFEFHKSGFLRELPSMVQQKIVFQIGIHDKQLFSILCGLNSRVLWEKEHVSEGWIFGEYLTPQYEWDRNHSEWPCSDDATVRESLIHIRDAITPVIVPWFNANSTLTQVADHIRRDVNRGLWSGKLYFHDRNFTKAKEILTQYRVILLKRPTKPSTEKVWAPAEEIEAELREVDTMLSQINEEEAKI